MRLITAESSSVLSSSEQTGCVWGRGEGGEGERWGGGGGGGRVVGVKPGINVDCVMVD